MKRNDDILPMTNAPEPMKNEPIMNMMIAMGMVSKENARKLKIEYAKAPMPIPMSTIHGIMLFFK